MQEFKRTKTKKTLNHVNSVQSLILIYFQLVNENSHELLKPNLEDLSKPYIV